MHNVFNWLRQAAYLLILSLGFAAAPAGAQVGLPTSTSGSDDPSVTLPDPLTPDAANALISRLSDTEVRALLLDQLNTQAVAQDTSASEAESEFLYHATAGAWSSVTVPIERLSNLFSGQARAFTNFFDKIGGWSGLLSLLGYMIVTFGIAAVAEMIFRRLTSGWRILPLPTLKTSTCAKRCNC